MIDLFLTYRIIEALTKPFTKWTAFKTGVIDEKGNILIPKKERAKDRKINASFTKFDLLMLKVKKILNDLPTPVKAFATYKAAMWLIKEQKNPDLEMLTEEIANSVDNIAGAKPGEEPPWQSKHHKYLYKKALNRWAKYAE